MPRFDIFRDWFSSQTLITLLAVIVAPLLGVAIVAATQGQITSLIIAGGIIGLFATLYAPVERLILLRILSALLADTRLVSPQITYYIRLVPTGMLTIRTLIARVSRRALTLRSE